jgi:hypothetical protein
MLLVDDDQPELAHGCEDRRARSDQHPRLSRFESLPDAGAFALGEPGVQHLDQTAKATPHAGGGLRCERDLRDEDDHATPLLQRVCSGPEEHLGLAGPGHAMEQQLAAAPVAVDRLLQAADRGELRLRRVERCFEIRRRRIDLDELALRRELPHGCGGGTRARGDVAERSRRILGGAEDRRLAGTAHRGPVDGCEPRIGRRRIPRRWQHELERPRRRRGVALADLERQVDELRWDATTRVRRRLECDPRGDVLGRRSTQDDALLLAPPERNLHDGAGWQLACVRQRPFQPARRDERYDDNGVRAQRGARRPCRCAPS